MASGFAANRFLQGTANLVRSNLRQCDSAPAEAAFEIQAALAWMDGQSRDAGRDIIDHLEAARTIIRDVYPRTDPKVSSLLDSCLHQLRFEKRRLEHIDRMTQG